jgi:hypothetical protein
MKKQKISYDYPAKLPTNLFDHLIGTYKKSKGSLFKISAHATDIKSFDKKTGKITYLEPTCELVKIIGDFEKEDSEKSNK